jgi:hypothetical protein
MFPAWQIILIIVFLGAIVGVAYYFATKEGSGATTVVAGATAPSPLKVTGMSLAIDTPGPRACLPDDMIKDSVTASRPVVKMTDESTRLMMELLRGGVAYNMFTFEPPKAGEIAGYWLSKTIGDAGAAAVARTLGLASTAASGNQFVVYMEFPSEFSVETYGAGEFLAGKAFFFAGSSRSLKPSSVRSQWAKSCNPPMPDITVRCKGASSSLCEYVGDGSVAATVAAGETLQLLSSCSPALLASRLLLWVPEKPDVVASYATCYASTQAATTQAATPRAATTRAATTQAATTRPATTQAAESCAGVDPSIKGRCYVRDETANAEGAYRCSTDMDCNGLRTCSVSGYCGEGPDYTRPAGGGGG